MHQLRYQLRYALPLWFVGLLTDWWPDNRVSIRIRGALCRPFFKRCGRHFTLARRVTFLNLNGIEIEDNVYIATGAWIDGMGGVRIGSHVKLSPYVVLASSSHVFQNGAVNGSRAAPIVVGEGSWLSSHVIVAAGVTIGRGCLIAGNAAVVKSIPDHMMAGGVPAKVLGPVTENSPTVVSRFEPARLGGQADRHTA
ncbi:MAG: acyltransferase [Planctomycetota bacterium]